MKKKRKKKFSPEDKEPSRSRLKEKNSNLQSQILNFSSLTAPNPIQKIFVPFFYLLVTNICPSSFKKYIYPSLYL